MLAPQAKAMDSKFRSALERAAEIVATWPRWKQTSLIVTAMAKSPEERKPVEGNSTGSEVNDEHS